MGDGGIGDWSWKIGDWVKGRFESWRLMHYVHPGKREMGNKGEKGK
jgi:hypothetical protein